MCPLIRGGNTPAKATYRARPLSDKGNVQTQDDIGCAAAVDGKCRRGAPYVKTFPIREHWKGQPPARVSFRRRHARAHVAPHQSLGQAKLDRDPHRKKMEYY